ncbi:MAG: hypothetical protein ABH849_04120 [Nanoarchaeota archaeon]
MQERMVFSSKEDMIAKVKELILARFGYNVDGLLKQSKLLNRINTQLKLKCFLP